MKGKDIKELKKNNGKIIDSYEIIMKLLGKNEKEFIEWGLNEIIIPDEKKVKDEWEALKRRINKESVYDKKNKETKDKAVYVRQYGRTGAQQLYDGFYKDKLGLRCIAIDTTNNNQPKKIVQKTTKCTFDEDIINYQISHVWGRTKNMYLFEAPWNIVLVPKILDPLTGHEAKGDLAKDFRYAFQCRIYKEFEEFIDDYNRIIEEQDIEKKCKEYSNELRKKMDNGELKLSDRQINDFKKSLKSEFAKIERPKKEENNHGNILSEKSR